ncbi:hypothetical protein V2J09_011348 [Rumex salicifolius]
MEPRLRIGGLLRQSFSLMLLKLMELNCQFGAMAWLEVPFSYACILVLEISLGGLRRKMKNER